MNKFNSTIVAVAMIYATAMHAQDVEPTFEQKGELIKGTYYYEDGNIRQEGTYKNGKLHGEWISYKQNGEKNTIAKYEEGNKTGKWFFWSDDILTEVDYSANRIAEVKNYKNTKTLVIRD